MKETEQSPRTSEFEDTCSSAHQKAGRLERRGVSMMWRTVVYRNNFKNALLRVLCVRALRHTKAGAGGDMACHAHSRLHN